MKNHRFLDEKIIVFLKETHWFFRGVRNPSFPQRKVHWFLHEEVRNPSFPQKKIESAFTTECFQHSSALGAENGVYTFWVFGRPSGISQAGRLISSVPKLIVHSQYIVRRSLKLKTGYGENVLNRLSHAPACTTSAVITPISICDGWCITGGRASDSDLGRSELLLLLNCLRTL